MKKSLCYRVVPRGHLAAVLAVVLAVSLSVLAASVGRSALPAATSPRRMPIYCTEKQEKVLSISFDAAWGAEDTGQLIDIMAQHGVKATFFVVGEWVDKYPEAVKALHDAGHEIMNHSDSHPHMTNLSKEKMMQELNICNDKIQAITGQRPILHRPPYGDYNNALIEVLEEMGMFGIQWDVDSLDWKNLSAAEITSRVTQKVKPGSIVLFHNAAKNTPEALPEILKKLLEDGYRFVKISELIYRENYEINHEGRQCPTQPTESGTE